MNHLAIILFGANLGDRAQNIRSAFSDLEEKLGSPEKISALYETAAWGFEEQPAYLNAVAGFRTELGPLEVLNVLLSTEENAGRVRSGHQYESRTIDLDLLLFDDQIIDMEGLHVPHPRMNLRKFTLLPLCDIYPDMVHPSAKKTIRELLSECPDAGVVMFYDNLT